MGSDQITIRIPAPGEPAFEDVGDLHAELYGREYGFGERFAGHVYTGLRELDSALPADPHAGRLWVVEHGGEVRGAIGVTRQSPQRAQLRWLLLHPDLRGSGTGRELLRRAVEYGRASGFASIFLTTIPELTAAAHLYADAGFEKIEEQATRPWGGPGVVEIYALTLTQPNVNA